MLDGAGNVVKNRADDGGRDAVASVGQPAAQHVDYAARLLGRLPSRLHEALQRADEAELAMFALALEPDAATREAELGALAARRGDQTRNRVADLHVYVGVLARHHMLTLADLAVPAIKEQRQKARDAFLADLTAMVEVDRRVTLREFVLLTLLRQRLREGAGQPIRTQFRSIEQIAADAHARDLAGRPYLAWRYASGVRKGRRGAQARLAGAARHGGAEHGEGERVARAPAPSRAVRQAWPAQGVLRGRGSRWRAQAHGGRTRAHGGGDARLPGAAASRRAGSKGPRGVKTFFEHQQLARRNSRAMVVLFLLAVAAIIVAVDFVLGAVWLWTNETPATTGVYVTGALATAGLIFIVSLFNVLRLGSGGAAVARMVGARPVAPNTADPLERRLRNVVEEMAIASGTRVPEVYVMDEESGINAFAAGWSVSGAVVAVTRGTLERLTRDELQGVIGHEFSHILNGDMRLNVRMIGVLAGIVFLGSIGEFVMRSVRGTKDKEALALFVLGVALFVIGYVGLFFARLIKAAVSRQREFLADASSVQFTRNPDAIAGALDQIRSSATGTLIANRYAEEMSHMFFGQSVKMWMGGLFNTHPPLDERIRRVQPALPGLGLPGHARQRCRGGSAQLPRSSPTGRRSSDLSAQPGGARRRRARRWSAPWTPARSIYAARLLAAIPRRLRDALRDPEQARRGDGRAAARATRSGDGAPAAGDPGRFDRRAGARRGAADARPRPRLPPAGDRPRARRAQAAAGRGEARGARGDRGGDPCRPPRVAARVRGARAAAQPAAARGRKPPRRASSPSCRPRPRRCSRWWRYAGTRADATGAREAALQAAVARGRGDAGNPRERAVAGGAHAGFGQRARSRRCAASRRCRKACW